MIADPVGGSGDGGSPVSWAVEERERERGVRRERGSWTGDMTLMREERESGGGGGGGGGGSGVGWGGGAEGIWFGASRASFLACRIPGDQHHGVSFHPPTHIHPPSSPPRTTASIFFFQ